MAQLNICLSQSQHIYSTLFAPIFWRDAENNFSVNKDIFALHLCKLSSIILKIGSRRYLVSKTSTEISTNSVPNLQFSRCNQYANLKHILVGRCYSSYPIWQKSFHQQTNSALPPLPYRIQISNLK